MNSNRQKMTKRSSLTLIPVVVAMLLSAGCAGTGSTQTYSSNNEIESAPIDIQHIVVPGDRLGDIALRYTGQVQRWEEIAAFNEISNPRALRIGDVITIPASMIPPGMASAGHSAAPGPASGSLKAASQSDTRPADTRPDVTATTGALAIQRTRESTAPGSRSGTGAESSPGEGSMDVVVQPVTINRTFKLEPIDPTSLNITPGDTSAPPMVKVLGTYYPKGVYQQPASYSALMMRVAPGTMFELEREINDWYKVITDQGVGYLRMVDGTLMSSEQAGQP